MSRLKNTNSKERGVSEASYTGGVTIADVAKLAGVSPMTVSRVLNQPSIVSAKTIEKVNKAIARTGYVPNLLAGGLASRRSRLIAAIVPSIINPMYMETIGHFIGRLEDAGYQVLLGESGYTTEGEEKLLTAILGRRPDAIFLTGTQHSPESRRLLLSAKIPVAETWDLTKTPIDVVVGFSHEGVGQSIAQYFIKKGYRRMGIISADDPRAQLRKHEFAKTLAVQGISDVAAINVAAPPNLRDGRNAVAELLNNGFVSGAIFCSSDTLAHGALIEAMARGLSLPKDIAIMGFGDQSFSEFTYPALSTVHIDREAIGHGAAEALLARIKGEEKLNGSVDVGFHIIERQTA